MTQIAKLFRSGRSQAVLLPDGYRFDRDEVEINRDGDAVVLRPRRTGAWTSVRRVGAVEECSDELLRLVGKLA